MLGQFPEGNTTFVDQLPRAGRKARLVSALMTLFGGMGIKIVKPTSVDASSDSERAPTSSVIQSNQRDSDPLGTLGLSVRSVDRSDNGNRRNFMLYADFILHPTILEEATNSQELNLTTESLLAGIQEQRLTVNIIPLTSDHHFVIYTIKSHSDPDSPHPWELHGHAYQQHPDHFTYELARKYNVGDEMVIIEVLFLDPSTLRGASDQPSTTLIREGSFALPEGCADTFWPQSCSTESIQNWLQFELDHMRVGVRHIVSQ